MRQPAYDRGWLPTEGEETTQPRLGGLKITVIFELAAGGFVGWFGGFLFLHFASQPLRPSTTPPTGANETSASWYKRIRIIYMWAPP